MRHDAAVEPLMAPQLGHFHPEPVLATTGCGVVTEVSATAGVAAVLVTGDAVVVVPPVQWPGRSAGSHWAVPAL